MTSCKESVITTWPRIFIICACTEEVWLLLKFLNIKEKWNRKESGVCNKIKERNWEELVLRGSKAIVIKNNKK